MPAQSKAQQRFMGMVHAVQKGDMDAPSKEVEKAADSMTKKAAKDYASTSHKGLPNKKENMKITKERLKELVKEVMTEESEYQAFFQKALDKAGKSIPSMSDEEKKAFFNKIDAAWQGRGEKNEALVGGQKELDVDGDGDIEGDDLADLRAGKKANEAMASGQWVGFTKTPKGKKYHATFSSGKQAEQWAIKNKGGAMPKSDWDSKEAKYAVK